MLPCFFALDHYNYARWLTIHWFDMVTLDQTNCSTLAAFNSGDFVIKRTKNPFSSMGIDQCHEQLNTIVKGDGGALGLTEDEDKFRKWMVCSPEISRMVNEFEHVTVLSNEDTQFRHHEDTPGFQKQFNSHYKSLVKEFEKLGNPFISDNPNEVIQIDTRDIMPENVVETINQIEDVGKTQAEAFLNDRIINKKIPIDAPIKKNKLPLFSIKCLSSTSNMRFLNMIPVQSPQHYPKMVS